MIEIDEVIVDNLIFHRFGTEGNLSFVNAEEYHLQGGLEEEVIKRIFVKPFLSAVSTYEFTHDVDLKMNVLFNLAKDIYEDENFTLRSQEIHQHLKSVSKHPNIKDGDLFVIKFDNLKMDNNYYKALGIYKVETKENFIETNPSDTSKIGLDFRQGIGTKKLDKAVLIVFSEEPYTVFVIDNASKETDYWINEFAKVDYRKDYVNSTNQFLDFAKVFITEQIPSEYEVSKADQIDLLNRSVDYFKKHDTFEKEDFEKEVLQEEEVIESFQNFDQAYSQEKDLVINHSFEISPQAVKKQARNFKSVLKLDKNFHVYIHGDRNLIEQGEEPDGRKFYKIYYEEES